MGAKSKIEQAIRRAEREGRLDDAEDLRRELNSLKTRRADRAWAKEHTYTVQPGDSYFSIAGQEMGDERWVQELIRANPGVMNLYPGMQIVLPSAKGETPSVGAAEFTDITTAYAWTPDGGVANVETPDAEETPSEVDTQQPEQPEEPMTAEEEDALVEQAATELEQLVATSATETPSGFDARKVEAAQVQQTPPPPTVTPTLGATDQPQHYTTWEERQRATANEARAKWDTPTPSGLPTPQSFSTFATTSPTQTSTPAITEHTVQEGDTLLRIVMQTGVSLKHILDANNLDVNDPLQINQHIVIPLENANPFKPTDFIKSQIMEFEGYLPNPETDGGRDCSVGYGHTIHEGPCNGGVDELPFYGTDQAEAEKLLETDLLEAEETVKAYVDVKLTQNQFDALVDFTFNLGSGHFIDSTVREMLNLGEYDAAADEILLYDMTQINGEDVTLPGLTTRRKFESRLFGG